MKATVPAHAPESLRVFASSRAASLLRALRHPRGISTHLVTSLLPWALGLAALGLYLGTMAPTITWRLGGSDGAELSAAAYILGVAHPPGYPLYLLLGHLFTWLPVGEVAYRVGLLSALSAAVGVVLVSHLAARLVPRHGRDDTHCHPERRAKHLLVDEACRCSTRRSLRETQGRLFAAAQDDSYHNPCGGGLAPEETRRGGSAAAPRARALAALGAGGCLACAPLYWSQAVVQEVYALHAALMLGTLVLLAAWRPGRGRVLAGLGLLLGLSMGNHLTTLFLILPAAAYLIARDPGLVRRRDATLAMGAFLLGLSIYAYLPLRALADPPINWGDPSSPGRFLAHVTCSSYTGYLGGRPAGEVAARLPVVARLLIDQATLPGLVVAFAGLLDLCRRRVAFGRALLGYLVLTTLFALLYNAENGEVYLLPLVLALSLSLGLGIASLAMSRAGVVVALFLAVALPCCQICTHRASLDLSADFEAATYARDTLANAPPGALLVTDRDERTFALWYVQLVEGLRPDVVVADDRLLDAGWYRAQLERRHPGLLEQGLRSPGGRSSLGWRTAAQQPGGGGP